MNFTSSSKSSTLIVLIVATLATGQSWSYDDSLANGPSSWAALFNPQNSAEVAFAACEGGEQSPIDIRGVSSGDTATEGVEVSLNGGQYAVLNYALEDLPLKWTGMTNMSVTVAQSGKVLRLTPADEGKASFADPNTGISYTFQYADIHTPSEHYLAGVVTDAEIQLVHTAKAANSEYPTLIIAIHVTAASSYGGHTDLKNMMDGFPEDLASLVVPSSFQGGGVGIYNVSAAQGAAISLANFFPIHKQYYTYDGSLTAPPCTESVKWYLMADSVQISVPQLSILRRAVGLPVSEDDSLSSSSSSAALSGNSRPTQAVGVRSLYYHQGDAATALSVPTTDGTTSTESTCGEALVCSDSTRQGTATSALVLSVLGAVCCVAALALRLTEESTTTTTTTSVLRAAVER